MDQVGLVDPSPQGVLVDLEGLGGREDGKHHCADRQERYHGSD